MVLQVGQRQGIEQRRRPDPLAARRLQGPDRLTRPAQPPLRRPQVDPRLDVVRILRDGPGQDVDRLLQAAAAPVERAQVRHGGGVVRVQLHRLPEGGLGFRHVLLPLLDQPQPVQVDDRLAVDLQSLADDRLERQDTRRVPVDQVQIGERLGQRGVEPQRFQKLLLGRRLLTVLEQERAERRPDLGDFRVLAGELPEVGDPVRGPATVRVDASQLRVDATLVDLVPRDELPGHLDGAVVVLLGLLDLDREQERGDHVGIDFQCLGDLGLGAGIVLLLEVQAGLVEMACPERLALRPRALTLARPVAGRSALLPATHVPQGLQSCDDFLIHAARSGRRPDLRQGPAHHLV